MNYFLNGQQTRRLYYNLSYMVFLPNARIMFSGTATFAGHRTTVHAMFQLFGQRNRGTDSPWDLHVWPLIFVDL
jgi:hypothetical protein